MNFGYWHIADDVLAASKVRYGVGSPVGNLSRLASGIGATSPFAGRSGEGQLSTHLGRSPQLSLRAASGHDGLKAPPTLPTRKATCCPPHVCRVGTSVTRFQINRDRDRLS